VTEDTKALLQAEADRLSNLAQACMDTATAEDNEVNRLKELQAEHALSRAAAREAANEFRRAADGIVTQITNG